MKTGTKFFYGTSGILLPFRNSAYYPEAYKESSRLNIYSTLNNSVEINSSFYKIPRRQTTEKWAADVSEDFRFTFKLFKGITHVKDQHYDPADIARFFDVINGVGDKKGCVLVQFPPSFKSSKLQQLTTLVNLLRDSDPEVTWNIALEFRDKTWYTEELYNLLKTNKMGLVLHDKPSSATPFKNPDVDFVYLRFHGPSGNYRESYGADFLAEYASYIQDWLDEGKQVFVYFNNTMGDALANLDTLKTQIR